MLILIVTNTCVYSVGTFLSGVVKTGLSIAHLVSACQSRAKYKVSPLCSGCLQYILNPEYVAIERYTNTLDFWCLSIKFCLAEDSKQRRGE